MEYLDDEDRDPTSPELDDLFLGQPPIAEVNEPPDPEDMLVDEPPDSQVALPSQNSRNHLVIPETQSTQKEDDTVLIDPPRSPPPAYTSRGRDQPTQKRKLPITSQDVSQDDIIDSFSTQPSHVQPVLPRRPKERVTPPKLAKGSLRPIPQPSPSVFRPYLAQPTSPIGSYSPERPPAVARSTGTRRMHERLPHSVAGSDEAEVLEAAYVDYSGGEVDAPGSPISSTGFVSRPARPLPGTISTQRADMDSQSQVRLHFYSRRGHNYQLTRYELAPQIILVKDSQPAVVTAALAERDEEIARLQERLAVLERAREPTHDDEAELLKMKNSLLQDEVNELRSERDLLKAESEDLVALAQLEEQANSLRMAEMEISELREALQSIRTTFSLSATDTGPLNPVTALVQKRLNKTEEELRKWKAICQVLQEKDKRTDDEVRKRAAEHPELVQELSILRGRLTTLESESEGLEMRTEALELEKEAMEQQIEQLRAQLDSERARAQETLAAAERDAQAQLRHDTERAELSKKLTEALRELEAGRAESASALEAERAQLQNRLDEIQVDLAMAREEAASQALRSAELESLMLDHAVLKDTLASLVEQRDQLKILCANLDSKASLLEEKHHVALQAQDSLAVSVAECAALKVRVGELETERDGLRVESAELRQSMVDSKHTAATQLGAHDREIERLSKERDDLTRKLEHESLETASLKGQVEGLSAQLQELQGHAAPLGDEVEGLKKDKRRLDQEVEILRLQRDDLDGQMRALTAEADAMRDGYGRVQEVERRMNDLVNRAPAVDVRRFSPVRVGCLLTRNEGPAEGPTAL